MQKILLDFNRDKDAEVPDEFSLSIDMNRMKRVPNNFLSNQRTAEMMGVSHSS